MFIMFAGYGNPNRDICRRDEADTGIRSAIFYSFCPIYFTWLTISHTSPRTNAPPMA
jgi:hypothetical protein